MFSPTGKPTLCLGQRSNIEEVIAKFAQLTPQEREKRKLESLEALKKTFKKLDHEVNIQEFLGSSTQTIEELTSQLKLLQDQISEVQPRLSCWMEPEKVADIDQIRAMEQSLKESIDRIRSQKRYWMLYRHIPLKVTPVTSVQKSKQRPMSKDKGTPCMGISPSIIGGFSGLCAFMGVSATFMSAALVKKLGILKAGAAGLILQSSLLMVAVTVLLSGSVSRQTSLHVFLYLIVLSRLGHMSYDVVGTQILQTGIPTNKANLIGTTEISIASLAELVMLGVAILANDVSHFGFLAMLSSVLCGLYNMVVLSVACKSNR
ncbi:hypothetical protein J5N97_018343 [Dioscorea zingiberensis]|uniref:Solute carrier family 40 member n=1 Tax=Dioscorea zingiberensis TaxID=325984 RepID=A0A9D5CMR0_9LILI|nr:hypothetical protein J5N97_018343 [Dioscorea zingiberensis]